MESGVYLESQIQVEWVETLISSGGELSSYNLDDHKSKVSRKRHSIVKKGKRYNHS